MRILNGRLLKHEVFEQLVNPQRPLNRASTRIHGIEARLLVSQPTLGEVLADFHRFCEDTVLVAYNAAFDIFLELKEAATGIRFNQPVLDTLLLSAVVHPSLEDHRLEAIAERLGVRVIGRHTALGDALLTGAILLKLIPLLAESGIVTLKQARGFAADIPRPPSILAMAQRESALERKLAAEQQVFAPPARFAGAPRAGRVHRSLPVDEVARLMREQGVGSVVVVDGARGRSASSPSATWSGCSRRTCGRRYRRR